MRSRTNSSERSKRVQKWHRFGLGCCLVLVWSGKSPAYAQQAEPPRPGLHGDQDLQRRVEQLETEVAELRRMIQEKNSSSVQG